MNEDVYFNAGAAVASSPNFKEATRSAQIIKAVRPTGHQIAIAINDMSGIYAVYYADKMQEDQTGTAYHIEDKL